MKIISWKYRGLIYLYYHRTIIPLLYNHNPLHVTASPKLLTTAARMTRTNQIVSTAGLAAVKGTAVTVSLRVRRTPKMGPEEWTENS
jgi:hypothetical protein